MKKVLAMIVLSFCVQAQAQNYFSESPASIKIGGGYAKDFPGLSGYAIMGEYVHSFSERLEGGFGMKRINMSGYPRSTTVNEFTKATTLDFNIYFLPVSNETNVFRIGAGYTFSFYKTRRSFPIIETHGTEKTTVWPIRDAKGRSTGIMLTGEYEYFVSSDVSLGIKASLCKAYDRIFYIGPFFGLRL